MFVPPMAVKKIEPLQGQGTVVMALPARASLIYQTHLRQELRPATRRQGSLVPPMAVKKIEPQGQGTVVMALPAPVKKAAAVKNQAAVKSKKAAAPPARFARGTAVEVRSRIARVLSGRWLVIYIRAEVVVSAADSSYVVRYPAHNGKPSREARVPAEDVREARRIRDTPAAQPPSSSSKRPSPDQSTVTAEVPCKKTKIVRTGKGIPMDALRRFMEEVKVQYPEAELPTTRKRPC